MKPLLSQCLIGYKFGRGNVDKDYFLCCRIPPIGNFNEDGTYTNYDLDGIVETQESSGGVAYMLDFFGNSEITTQLFYNPMTFDLYYNESDEEDDSIIYGCTDPNAKNYDPNATQNDGSCVYDDDDLQP